MSNVPDVVIMRRPSPRMSEGTLTFMERQSVDPGLAEQQHRSYREAVSLAGLTLIDLPPLDDFPDSTFVEDVLLAFPECFVLCRPGASSRLQEPGLIAPSLPGDRPVFQIEEPATIDGGDVLQIGREVYVGLSRRTNEAAIASLAHILDAFGYSVKPVAVTGSLHLKTAATAVGDLLVANPAWVDLSVFGTRQVVTVDASEPFAGNVLSLGGKFYAQTAHGRTTTKLRALGLELTPLDISEFAKVEAGLTCMSVVAPRYNS